MQVSSGLFSSFLGPVFWPLWTCFTKRRTPDREHHKERDELPDSEQSDASGLGADVAEAKKVAAKKKAASPKEAAASWASAASKKKARPPKSLASKQQAGPPDIIGIEEEGPPGRGGIVFI